MKGAIMKYWTLALSLIMGASLIMGTSERVGASRLKCAEDSAQWAQGTHRECVPLALMNESDRAYSSQWVTYCGRTFATHRRPVMTYHRAGSLTGVRCAR
jgi:hypothetical protein